MNYTGLVSVTHRDLPADAVIELAVQAGLDGIEWGGDVHVPHGNLAEAKRVGCVTRAAGLRISAYGSYYRAGKSEPEGLSFLSVLDTAEALQTPVIRVWAGCDDFEKVDDPARELVVDDLRRICSMASSKNIIVAMEFHAWTLNNSPAGTSYLVSRVAAPNLKTYWQPRTGSTDSEALESILAVKDHLLNVHVFNWITGRADQTLLVDAEKRWNPCVAELTQLPGDRFFSIEFVKDNLPENTLKDAATLREWIGTDIAADCAKMATP